MKMLMRYILASLCFSAFQAHALVINSIAVSTVLRR